MPRQLIIDCDTGTNYTVVVMMFHDLIGARP